MGLITKEVEISLKGSNKISYYESLGYEIPKKLVNGKYKVNYSVPFFIKTEHLSDWSNVKVEVECDECKEIFIRCYYDYKKQQHGGDYYCKKCSHKVFLSGENNPRYNHNKTDEERIIRRNYPEYTEFVKRVLKRDNYTCKCCGKYEQKMYVHHLYSYATYKEYRTDDRYAVTLCKSCHEAFHCKYGKNEGNNTPEQFYEWLGVAKLELERYDGELPTTKKVICLETKEIWDSAELCGKSIKSLPESVRACCTRQNNIKTVKGCHYMYLEEYNSMKDYEIDIYLLNNPYLTSKIVVCITTGEIFQSVSMAIKKYNATNIFRCCYGEKRTAGKLEDGTRLKWMYYDDYAKLVNQEYMGNYTY